MKKLAFLFGCLTILLSACQPTVSGNGRVDERNFEVDRIDQLEISGMFDVFARQGSSDRLMIKTDDNFFDYIEVQTTSNSVDIEMERIPRNITNLEIYVQVSDLSELELNEAINLEARGISGSDFRTEVNGSSDLELDVSYGYVQIEANGASELRIQGTTEKASARINGAGDLFAEEWECREMDIEVNGAGTAEIWVKNKLEVEVHGAGKIRYKGNPDIRQEVTGAGSVKRID